MATEYMAAEKTRTTNERKAISARRFTMVVTA
jgi:hypothetical protein